MSAIIDLPDEESFSDLLRGLDRRMREYTRAPGVSAYVRAASIKPKYLEHVINEHLYVMVSRSLERRLKEMIAVVVSMINGCRYCTTAHSRILRRLFRLSDEEVLEVNLVAAHVSGINAFEHAYGIGTGGEGPAEAAPEEAAPILREIEERLGVLPLYYLFMARDPRYLGTVWGREKIVMLDGRIGWRDKEYLALAASIVNRAPYSISLHRGILRRMGETEEEILEAVSVVEVFTKNNVFTDGLNLPLGVWEKKEG